MRTSLIGNCIFETLVLGSGEGRCVAPLGFVLSESDEDGHDANTSAGFGVVEREQLARRCGDHDGGGTLIPGTGPRPPEEIWGLGFRCSGFRFQVLGFRGWVRGVSMEPRSCLTRRVRAWHVATTLSGGDEQRTSKSADERTHLATHGVRRSRLRRGWRVSLCAVATARVQYRDHACAVR